MPEMMVTRASYHHDGNDGYHQGLVTILIFIDKDKSRDTVSSDNDGN